tara:strand:- start:97 stop:648 length:552 start_codon:yes stop_codon:yes gene_type:complete
MGKTLKVKTAGRFGSRYGVGIRKRVIKVETLQKAKHRCPDCGFDKVKRTATGIYECKKCSAKFAGGAYVPETMSGSIVRKMVTQKAFLPYAKELIEVKETGAKTVAKEVKEQLPETSEDIVKEKPAKAKAKASKPEPKAKAKAKKVVKEEVKAEKKAAKSKKKAKPAAKKAEKPKKETKKKAK